MQESSETIGETWSNIWTPEVKCYFYLLIHENTIVNIVQVVFFPAAKAGDSWILKAENFDSCDPYR